MAAFAHITGLGAVLRQRRDLGGIAMAFRAVYAHGIIGLPLPLLRILRPEGVQNVKDLPPLAQRFNHIVFVFAAPIHLALISVVHLNAEPFDGGLEFPLEIFRIILFLRTEGVGRIHIGRTDVFLHIAVHLGHVHGNLPDSVIFVPGEQKLRLFSLSLQRLHHEEAGGNVPEITDMDGARRTDARSAYIFFLVRVPADDFVCYSV